MASNSATFAGLLLIAAGLYQWTPFETGLSCPMPVSRRTAYEILAPGSFGPFLSGCRNGAFCLGCCWLLMALLFVGGLMNLLWIAALSLLVLIEKALPAVAYSSRLIGAAFITWGTSVLLA